MIEKKRGVIEKKRGRAGGTFTEGTLPAMSGLQEAAAMRAEGLGGGGDVR